MTVEEGASAGGAYCYAISVEAHRCRRGAATWTALDVRRPRACVDRVVTHAMPVKVAIDPAYVATRVAWTMSGTNPSLRSEREAHLCREGVKERQRGVEQRARAECVASAHK